MNLSHNKSAHFSAIVPAPFGLIGIRTEHGALRELVYLPPDYGDKAPTDALAKKIVRQLESYYADPDFRFDLPLAEVGTVFQRRVWEAMCNIPRGETLTYGQVAKHLRTAPRAVGQACGANWFPIIIPCHRIIATGGLGGFSNHSDQQGFYLGVKRWLLAHEGAMEFDGLT